MEVLLSTLQLYCRRCKYLFYNYLDDNARAIPQHGWQCQSVRYETLAAELFSAHHPNFPSTPGFYPSFDNVDREKHVLYIIRDLLILNTRSSLEASLYYQYKLLKSHPVQYCFISNILPMTLLCLDKGQECLNFLNWYVESKRKSSSLGEEEEDIFLDQDNDATPPDCSYKVLFEQHYYWPWDSDAGFHRFAYLVLCLSIKEEVERAKLLFEYLGEQNKWPRELLHHILDYSLNDPQLNSDMKRLGDNEMQKMIKHLDLLVERVYDDVMDMEPMFWKNLKTQIKEEEKELPKDEQDFPLDLKPDILIHSLLEGHRYDGSVEHEILRGSIANQTLCNTVQSFPVAARQLRVFANRCVLYEEQRKIGSTLTTCGIVPKRIAVEKLPFPLLLPPLEGYEE